MEAYPCLMSLTTELGCVTRTLIALTSQTRRTATARVDQRTSGVVTAIALSTHGCAMARMTAMTTVMRMLTCAPTTPAQLVDLGELLFSELS